jgi:hypothetical protein
VAWQKTFLMVISALLMQMVKLHLILLLRLTTLVCLVVFLILRQMALMFIKSIGLAGTTGTDIIAYIYDDPFVVYKVQSAGTPAQTNIGNCADVVAGAGSTTTGQSGFEISGTMSNGTATCKIVALWDSPENAFGANAVLEVLINEHLYKDSAGI